MNEKENREQSESSEAVKDDEPVKEKKAGNGNGAGEEKAAERSEDPAARAESKEKPKKTVSADAKDAEKEGEGSKAPTAADLLKDEFSNIKIRRAKGSKNIHSGVVHILATFNNTKVSFTDLSGNVISWSSAGKCGFRGSRKSTAYAAQIVTQDAGRAAMGHGLREIEVKVKGPGMGRDSAVRALQSLGFSVLSITDVTPVPHNGCRPPKRRRV